MNYHHVSVFLDRAITDLSIVNDGKYIDCTLGGGGHFSSIFEKLQKGCVIGIDVDKDAIEKNRKDIEEKGFVMYSSEDSYFFFSKGDLQLILVQENFKNILQIVEVIAKKLSWSEIKIDGILFDFGVSSYQIDTVEKGFSYMQDDTPLDMRMDQRLQVRAADLINGMYEKELEYILQVYGEEIYAKRIAKAIISERKHGMILTSGQLKKVITRSVSRFYKNPYAKTFQALRIAVNGELESIERTLMDVDTVLRVNGRVVCISFHSLEDRLVKERFGKNASYKEVDKVMKGSEEEIAENKRARSAKLRSYQKISYT